MRHAVLPVTVVNPWLEGVFSAKAVARGGVVRRAVRDVEREIGRLRFVAEVRRRGFHLVECGGQFIVICNPGQMQVLC
ncbi:MAG: N-(5'-phosphoribosyl)anthranilate isomerase [Rhodobacterales bacterium 32-66-7]|nr:MAG: N-(5'-phosphoribosyl)anthranilate isomerase [Rhodobacterales bacterium 12-65-15]OYX25854.1 MAG: N-(5'-phosphoribosyl)anthranilate isomerase [Rhodobacterales bacterium 32-66-7]